MNIQTTYAVTFIVSFCSIVYELLLAQTLSTVLGNTVLRYSLTIGFYLAAKGAGAMLCGTRRRDSARTLLRVEMMLIMIGGLSVILINLFDVIQKYVYARGPVFQQTIFLDGCLAEIIFFVLSQSVIIVIGILSGFEIPLLIDIAEREKSGTTHMILGVDYFGSLAGSILFPLVLLPSLGIFSISFATAFLNGLAGLGIIYFKNLSRKVLPTAATVLLSALLILGFSRAADIKQFYLKKFYFDTDIQTVSDIFLPTAVDRPPIANWESPYQHIELISASDSFSSMVFHQVYSGKWAQEPDYPNDKWLFMNGKFQFFSLVDEIYHEYFVHIPIILTQVPKRVCILGGGDGLVARELLKHPEIREIYQVELDPKIIEIAKNHPVLLKMNKGAFHNPRLNIITQDAFFFIQHNQEKFDAIYIDFPTPNDYNLSILYSQEFYSLIRRNLKENGFAAMDMPSGEFFDEDSNFQIYYSTVKSAGFRQVFPISSILESDNPEALELLDEDFILEEIDAVDQQFLFMSNSSLPLNRTFKHSGVELYVLNDKRFKLAFPPFPDQVIPSLVNSIFKPTLPDFYLFDINYPF